MNIKLRALELLRQYEEGKYSNIALNEYLKINKLSNGEKAFLTEVFYGVIRNIIFLDYQIDKRAKKIKKQWIRNLLRISIYQTTFMDSDNKGIAWEATELTKKKFGPVLGKFVNGLLRNYMREMDNEIKDLENKKDYGRLLSYPQWFVEKINKQYGDKSLDLLKSLKETPLMSYRVNNLKYTREEFEDLIGKNNLKIINQIGDLYYVQGRSLLDTAEFAEGKIIVQDGSSYLASTLLDAQENHLVLDSCSAPGGKTFAIADTMNNKGKIVALDIHEHKIELIEKNGEKLGIDIIDARLKDGRKAEELNEEFDRILVDAPCSGFGVIRKKPEGVYNKTMKNVKELSQLQYDILSSSSKRLKKGGKLIYSTCTLLQEENKDNLAKFLGEHKDYEVEEINIPENVEYIKDDLGGITIIDKYLDGFYIVKLKKVD